MSTRYEQLNVTWQGGYVALAFLLAVAGSWTTVELLLRRTGGSGWYNVLLLVGAGIAFGSTATWAMHFVGNQAVTLHLPGPQADRGIPLSYDVGFTILSLVVACLSMILAFSFIGLRLDSRRIPDSAESSAAEEEAARSEKDFELGGGPRSPSDEEQQEEDVKDKRFSWHPRNGSLVPSKAAAIVNLPRPRKEEKELEKQALEEDAGDEGEFGTRPAKVSLAGKTKILAAGIIAGGGIAAMHYVGQVSINSVPKVDNLAYVVFLSIFIAMVAVSTGLTLLFVVLRPKLKHTWYKRLGVAIILGIATSLMHFVALLGTRYYIVEGQSLAVPSNGARSRKLILALVCVVAPVCCIALLIFAFIGQQRLLRQIAARHRIVLAVAIFDQQGLLLCQQDDGLLPSAKIYPTNETSDAKTGVLQFLGLRNRLSTNSQSKKLTRQDPAFIAFLRTSWAWRVRRGAGSTATGSSGHGTEEAAEGLESRTSAAPATALGVLEDIPGLTGDEEYDGISLDALRRAVMGFEMAGQEIATALTGSHNLQSTGVLFDGILKTGHFEVSSKNTGDSFTVTQGQMLVLTRRIRANAERDALLARGYVFAEPGAVARVTSNAFAVPNDRVFEYFRDVHRFSRFGVTRKVDRGRLYAGVLIVQAVPGEGLQLVVDEKQHHSLPMVEIATLVRHLNDKPTLPPSSLSVQTLESVVQAMTHLGGLSLHELLPESQLPYESAMSLISVSIKQLILSNLRPFLQRTFSFECLSFLLSRLIITPHLIPLSERGGPTFGADGVTQDSYLICLKAVVPSAIVLPGKVNWLPFPLYKAQADCIARISGQHRSKTLATYSGGTGSRPQTATTEHEDVFPPSTSSAYGHTARHSIHSRTSEQDDDLEIEEVATPDPSTADPHRPAGLPRYDPDYVVGLVKATIEPSRTWNWELPTKELRRQGGQGDSQQTGRAL